MITKNTFTKNVKVLDQTYQVSYTEGEEDSLNTAVQYLNEQLVRMKEQNQSSVTSHLMAITALNLAHQLAECRHTKEVHEQQINQRLKNLNDTLSKKNYLEPPLKEFGASL